MAEFIVALQAVEIAAGENDLILLDEGGVTATTTIAPGTYFARGDGSADDLLAATATALGAAFAGGNTYALGALTAGGVASWSKDAASPSATVRVSRATGAATFRVRWNSASTTFPKALLGFAVEKTLADANPELSTLSPAAAWVPNDRHIDLLPEMNAARAEVELANGGLDAVLRAAPSHERRLLLELVDGRRLWAHRITADPDRAYSRFWRTIIDGRPVELHEVDLQSGSSTLLTALSTSTRIASDGPTSWQIVGESAERIAATRVRTGMDHWDLEVVFRGYVAP